jgi:sRNA-binding regulator protein Hfq
LKPYSEPYNYYISLQKTYSEEYASQFSSQNKIEAEKKVNDFFENDVKSNFSKMNGFFDSLLVFLENGKKLEIQIRGFTSPRAYSKYNIALGSRRVMSLKNQILQHRAGAFLPYLKSGSFVVKELSFGETKVPSGVSDRYNDPRNSIYSVEASRERRVEIVFLKSIE